MRTDIRHYQNLLIHVGPDICRRTVRVRGLFPRGVIAPLTLLSQPRGPGWWQAYNRVKHAEYDNSHDGNMRNALLSVAALVILEYFVDIRQEDGLWVDIGNAFMINVTTKSYLFSHTPNAEAGSPDRAPTATEPPAADEAPALGEQDAQRADGCHLKRGRQHDC